MEMTDIIARISADADNQIGVHFELSGEESIIAHIERVITGAARLLETGISGIVRTVTTKFTDMGRTVQSIIRRMMDAVDSVLRVEGFNTGRNFFRALGEGLISEQAHLLTQALQTAAAIRAAFESGHPTGTVPVTAMAKDDMRDGRGDFGESVINLYFYGVREEKNAFQAYRAMQKVVAREVR